MELQVKLPNEVEQAVIDLTKKAVKVAVSEALEQLPIPDYMNAQRASKYVGVSDTTFYSWIKKHDLKTVEIDGVKRYSRKSLDKFMKEYER
ncbi:helix-turn-helix domain-containing protein [Ligilactobacillus agilis]|uniref:helix-turn-helix domain-containing protein n=1 Tax=Ligilactobacillus agilis TaxID=1601 RepID=UPI003F8A92F3